MIFVNFCENYFELSCKSFSMATSFNAEDFMSEPDQDVFDSLRKVDLLALSLYLNLNVKKSWRKIDIQKAIVKHLISADIFDESSLSSYCVASEFDVKKLESSAQLELWKLESVEREREREEREKERQREEREREREREIELKKFELQNNLELKKLETESKVSHTDSECKFDVG